MTGKDSGLYMVCGRKSVGFFTYTADNGIVRVFGSEYFLSDEYTAIGEMSIDFFSGSWWSNVWLYRLA